MNQPKRTNQCDGEQREWPWVLCVDDDPNCVNALYRFFHRYEIRFASAYNAIQAFERITSKKPDLVLCDIRMPGVSGTELVDWLRRNSVVSETPVIVLSGQVVQKTARESIRHKANRFLSKPVGWETLADVIADYIPLRRRLIRPSQAPKLEPIR